MSDDVPIKPCRRCQTPKRIDTECAATDECIEANRAEHDRLWREFRAAAIERNAP